MPYFVQRNSKVFFTSLVILLVGTILLSLNVGKFPISPLQLGQAIRCVFETECQTPSSVETVLWHIRTPRILVACLVGAALAAAGATYQGMFKNPLVSPDILGVSSGAGLGASLAIFYNLPMFYVQLFAFTGGILAVLCVSMVASRSRNQDPILVLVLSGIAIGSLLGAGISLLKILADPFTQLPSITFWLLGSFTAVGVKELSQLAPILIFGILPLFLLRWRLNLLALEEDEAKSLGIPIQRTRYILIIFTTLCTASAVSITGIIGWVGLLVPHIARLLVGANFILLLPTSLLLGANGAGKSTFLKTLLGLQPALNGQILFQNRPLATYSAAELAREIAYVPQAHAQLFPFLVQDMVLMGRSAYLKWYQTPKAEDKDLALSALEELQITHLAKRYYHELSGGEKQLVLIARAIAQQAKLLIMDEPTASLDFGNQIRVLEKIKQLQHQNIALLITTHNPQQAAYLAENIAMLDQEFGLQQGEKSELMTLENLAKIYRTSVQELQKHLNL